MFISPLKLSFLVVVVYITVKVVFPGCCGRHMQAGMGWSSSYGPATLNHVTFIASCIFALCGRSTEVNHAGVYCLEDERHHPANKYICQVSITLEARFCLHIRVMHSEYWHLRNPQSLIMSGMNNHRLCQWPTSIIRQEPHSLFMAASQPLVNSGAYNQCSFQ